MSRKVIVMFRNVIPADSILRYREGDFNETVYIKGDEKRWTEYINLCREYREDSSIPSLKELQNEEIVTKDGFAKSGFIMFEDSYDGDDSLICCRLWKGKQKTGTVLDHDRFKGSIPSIRRNTIIAACLDEANLMERGGTGFQTMIESYKDSDEHLQPVVSIYPGFLNLRLYDRLYNKIVIDLKNAF